MADKQSEINELRRINAEPTKNSGRGKLHKGDGRIGSLVTVDVKEYKESFGLSKRMVAKLNLDSQTNGTRYGMFFVVLGEDEPKQRFACVPEAMYNELIEAYEEQHGIQ